MECEEKVYTTLKSLEKILDRTEKTARQTLQMLDRVMTETITKVPETILWENKIK